MVTNHKLGHLKKQNQEIRTTTPKKMAIRKVNQADTGTATSTDSPGTGTAAPVTGNVTLPPAGLPSRNPSRSYWLREPDAALVGYRGTAELPETADVVVVGSGITGGFAARFLLEGEGVGKGGKGEGEGEGLRVVMLEAREVCSGATGRVSLPFSFGCSVFFMGHGERGVVVGLS
jgi:hypothetical protein